MSGTSRHSHITSLSRHLLHYYSNFFAVAAAETGRDAEAAGGAGPAGGAGSTADRSGPTENQS